MRTPSIAAILLASLPAGAAEITLADIDIPSRAAPALPTTDGTDPIGLGAFALGMPPDDVNVVVVTGSADRFYQALHFREDRRTGTYRFGDDTIVATTLPYARDANWTASGEADLYQSAYHVDFASPLSGGGSTRIVRSTEFFGDSPTRAAQVPTVADAIAEIQDAFGIAEIADMDDRGRTWRTMCFAFKHDARVDFDDRDCRPAQSRTDQDVDQLVYVGILPLPGGERVSQWYTEMWDYRARAEDDAAIDGLLSRAAEAYVAQHPDAFAPAAGAVIAP